ncbi:peptide/nickel transport system ATP-binding protein [Paenibacillus sp. DS2015]|uniref:ABC transporter ATP-binding protein n=1 Tax=Paenibacillus sp. DS2015 TaxID=3373917 RepID=UPI003D22DA2E
MAILEVHNLSISFTKYTLGLRQQTTKVLDGVNLSAEAGEIVAVVGSSGSGKSLLAHAILGILPDHAVMTGTIRYKGEVLDDKRKATLRGREIALVPQSVNYLDPLIRVGSQVRTSVRDKDPVTEQRKIFKRYRLAEHVERLFPFQLSGGMARKVLVSTATVSGASLIVADEPTPGMHPEDVKEALQRFKELAADGCAVLFITHDIESALQIADRVVVFYAGTTVEIASAQDFTGQGERLRHPYSRALWQALPQNDFSPIAGTQPSPSQLPTGCLFGPRCPRVVSECNLERPSIQEVRGGSVRCIRAT